MNKRQKADKHNYERWLRLNARVERRAEFRRGSRRVGITGFGATAMMLAASLGRL